MPWSGPHPLSAFLNITPLPDRFQIIIGYYLDELNRIIPLEVGQRRSDYRLYRRALITYFPVVNVYDLWSVPFEAYLDEIED